jgi:hypothetical protein
MRTIHDDVNIVFFILSTLAFLINLCFLITGCIVAVNTDELIFSEQDFYSTWVCNLILTILAGLCALNYFCTQDNNKYRIFAILSVLTFGFSVWLLILWFNYLDLNLLEEQYVSLYILTKIRMYFTLIVTGIIFLGIIGGLIWLQQNPNPIHNPLIPSSTTSTRSTRSTRSKQVSNI